MTFSSNGVVSLRNGAAVPSWCQVTAYNFPRQPAANVLWRTRRRIANSSSYKGSTVLQWLGAVKGTAEAEKVESRKSGHRALAEVPVDEKDQEAPLDPDEEIPADLTLPVVLFRLARGLILPRPSTTATDHPSSAVAGDGDENDLRWLSPLDELRLPRGEHARVTCDAATKPLLLYLPGLDGSLLTPFAWWPDLALRFELRAMRPGMGCRATFVELKAAVVDQLERATALQSAGSVGDAASGAAESSSSAAFDAAAAAPEATAAAAADAASARDAAADAAVVSAFAECGGGRGSGSFISGGRPVLLMGESFGGLLAVAIASERPELVDRLVLVNPATSYPASRLARLLPWLCRLPPPLFGAGLALLAALVVDPALVKRVLSGAVPKPLRTSVRTRYLVNVLLTLPKQLELFTAKALRWRVEHWLADGAAATAVAATAAESAAKTAVAVLATEARRATAPGRGGSDDPGGGNRRERGAGGGSDGGDSDKHSTKAASELALSRLPPTLVIAGTEDRLLPSAAEAERLRRLLPCCRVHLVAGAGHAATLDERAGLADLLVEWDAELRGDG